MIDKIPHTKNWMQDSFIPLVRGEKWSMTRMWNENKIAQINTRKSPKFMERESVVIHRK